MTFLDNASGSRKIPNNWAFLILRMIFGSAPVRTQNQKSFLFLFTFPKRFFTTDNNKLLKTNSKISTDSEKKEKWLFLALLILTINIWELIPKYFILDFWSFESFNLKLIILSSGNVAQLHYIRFHSCLCVICFDNLSFFLSWFSAVSRSRFHILDQRLKLKW